MNGANIWPADMAAEVAEATAVEKAGVWTSPAGKGRLAKRLVRLLAPHTTYVEPFAGAGSVFFEKPACGGPEVLNDIDPEIAMAYRTIKGLTEEGIRKLTAMDWQGAKATYAKIYNAAPTDDLAKLHRFLYMASHSYGGFRGGGFNGTREGTVAKTVSRLAAAKARLKGATIRCGSYEKVIKEFDGAKTQFFLDPPYSGHNAEVREGAFDEGAFFDVLKQIEGKWLLTYGIKGKLPAMVRKQAGWTVKTIRPQRSLATVHGLDGKKILPTLLASNYGLQGDSSKSWLGETFGAFEADGWIVKDFDPSDIEDDDSPTPEISSEDRSSTAKAAISIDLKNLRKVIRKAEGEEPERHYVFGEVLVPDEEDAQGDIYSKDEVALAQRRFARLLAEDGQADHAGRQHKKRLTMDGVVIVENYLQKGDQVIEGRKVKDGTWLMGWEIVDPALWADIEADKVTGFSIGGSAVKTPLEAA